MLDPHSRPAPDLAALLATLAEHQVEWILTGSTVLALHGVAITPSDVDVVPEPSPANLTRLAAALSAIDAIPAGSTEPWQPEPATAERLEHLYVTRHGMLTVTMSRAGSYAELIGDTMAVPIAGVTVNVCDLAVLLVRVLGSTDPKHVERHDMYAKLAARYGIA